MRCLHEWREPYPARSGPLWTCKKCGEPRNFEHGPIPGTFEEASERLSNAVRNLGEEILRSPGIRRLAALVRR